MFGIEENKNIAASRQGCQKQLRTVHLSKSWEGRDWETLQQLGNLRSDGSLSVTVAWACFSGKHLGDENGQQRIRALREERGLRPEKWALTSTLILQVLQLGSFFAFAVDKLMS